MNVTELQSKLANSNVSPDAYCLTGGLPNEAYCIERGTEGKWNTYYSERGIRSGLKTFDTEEEACDQIYRMVIRYCRESKQGPS